MNKKITRVYCTLYLFLINVLFLIVAEGDVVCQLQIEVTSNSYRSGSFRGRISSVTNVINHSNQSVHYNTKG